MIAFVLSGGGNRGALQVGALQVLLEAGIRPEMLVGTSAGALNAAFLAVDPTPAGAHRLGEIWEQVTKEDVYPGGPSRVAWHLATHRDSLYSSENFASFLRTHTPEGVCFFRHLALPLYITAADLHSGRLYLFGEDPDESILEAILASSAIPPLFPPWPYRGSLLVDGGLAANLPVRVAVEKGATEIYALEACREAPPDRGNWNVWQVAACSINALVRQQWERDLALCAVHPEVTLCHLPLRSRHRLAFDDFGQAKALIAEGREAAKAYLAASASLISISKARVGLNGPGLYRRLGRRVGRLWGVLSPLAARKGGVATR